MPDAAAVVARIRVGHALSRDPDQAMIVIFFGRNSSFGLVKSLIPLPPRGNAVNLL
jgi:hypothetical protein